MTETVCWDKRLVPRGFCSGWLILTHLHVPLVYSPPRFSDLDSARHGADSAGRQVLGRPADCKVKVTVISGLPPAFHRVSVRFRLPSDAAAAAAAADGDFGFGAGGALAESLYSSPWFVVPVMTGGRVELGWELSVFITLSQEVEDLIVNEAVCFQARHVHFRAK